MAWNGLQRDEILESGFFDAGWYARRYPDVGMLDMDPIEHFVFIGQRLNRDPGPRFDSQKYLRKYGDVARHNLNPLLHYVRHGRHEGRVTFKVTPEGGAEDTADMPRQRRFAGNMARKTDRPTVLLCAHSAGDKLFGGERSLVDMADGLNMLDFNLVVTVPAVGQSLTVNPDYIKMLTERAVAVHVLPYGWWRKGVATSETTVADFAEIIADEEVDAVHTNTIMLREPLIAAERMGVKRLVHVRELIRYDQALLDIIGETAETIGDRIWESCDHVVANSRATQAGFARNGRIPALVYNTVDFSELQALEPPRTTGPLRVGLISSNLPKKGIWDLVSIAQSMSETQHEVEFHLIGPESNDVRDIAARVAAGTLPSSIKIAGYRETPAQAIAETDVVVSLSHFQESFGRTVLEAMAAARPVIVYDHGAPPEFVSEARTGFIVPARRPEAAAEAIATLARDRGETVRMGRAGRALALERFSRKAYAEQLAKVYDDLWTNTGETPRKMVLRPRADLTPMSRDKMRIAYFSWHFPVPSETFVLNELRLLREQGHEVRVFCKQSPYPDFTPDFDIEWERVRDADHLAQRLTETGITNVHAHFVYPTVTDMVWPACETAEVPFTCIAHAQDIFRYKNAAANRISEFARSPMCKRIFTLSEFHRNYLESRNVPAEKLMINSNCVDPDLFAGGKILDRPARKSRSICAVSRFAEKKGLDALIRAGKLLENDDITINIFGYGELEDDYRAILDAEKTKNVHLHGPVEGRKALMEVFRRHDLFACPSVIAHDGDMDGIPTTLMESIGAGLPVLTTEVAGIPDLVSDRVTGLVCEAEPEAIASKIRSFYSLPDAAVESMMINAEERLRRNHNGPDLVENLMRVWANETIDLMIVSWNNRVETAEVIRRLYRNTELPFHLIVCDNGSAPKAMAALIRAHSEHDNMTLVLNRDNALVGPGTNVCLENGSSDYAIYVCGKEGMTTRSGWEKPFVHYMNAHPEVGQAGTLCYSPSYLHGKDYPTGIALFPKFRNPEFATRNPERPFSHVQGGFFALRRRMIDEIGGFSEDVPHNSTDVEFSYYVESCGWKLGEIPGLVSLFNKTRPGLMHRIDESHGALHPPMLDDLPTLDRIARREVRHCNACGLQSQEFGDPDGDAVCPHCAATRRGRSIHRALAESILLYRRLPALGVNVPEALAEFWKQQFQGQSMSGPDFDRRLNEHGQLDFADKRLRVVLLNQPVETGPTSLREAARLLEPEGTLIVAGVDDTADTVRKATSAGFAHVATKRFTSSVSLYDWRPVVLFERIS